ncbi:nucleotidyltransferase family protein [bacterium]|nr:nucleotidyltransferase family protein [bacterium]
MLFREIFKAFAKDGLDYVVVGGIAVNLHGYARMTADLDIFVSLNDEDVLRFIKIVKRIGYVPRIPVAIEDFAVEANRKQWMLEKNMKVFSVVKPNSPLDHVDVLLEQIISFNELKKNAVIMKMDGISIPVASISHMIKLKKHAGRDRDLLDIKYLEKIQEVKDAKSKKRKK